MTTPNKDHLPSALLQTYSEFFQPLFRNWRELKQIPPVLLLVGIPGIQKRRLAHHLAKTFLCEKTGFTIPKNEQLEESGDLFGGLLQKVEPRPSQEKGLPSFIQPCEQCPSCLRFQHGNFLDFTEIQPEKDSSTLKIDQFRNLKETQGLSGFTSDYRIFLIPEAERLTLQASNSLLKLLEEPPPGWIFLLTIHDTSLLPTTVVSRCQLIRLKPIPSPLIEKILISEGIDSERAKSCASLSQGSLSRAFELSDEEVWEKKQQIDQFIQAPSSCMTSLVDWASSDRKNLTLLLDLFEQKLLERVTASAASSLFYLSQLERIFSLRKEMAAPLNLKILTQDFLLPWLNH